MRYHIVLNGTRWAQRNQEAELGKRPRDYIALLQKQLDAQIHIPDISANIVDKVRAKLWAGRPENWALSRKLSEQLTEQDVVFCNVEDSSMSFAAYCVDKKRRPKLVSLFQNFNHLRNLTTAKLLRIAQSTDLFIVGSRLQQELVCKHLNLPRERVLYLPQFVDMDFFTPGLPTSEKRRPIIASVGLENRDYRSIAEATQDLDLDVKICDTSRFAKRLTKSFPDVLPANMDCRYYEMDELIQLYRDADIFIMSVFESDYHAGSTSLVEAMACKRPIIATASKGLSSYLDPDAILTVKPGDAEGLKQAVSYLLNNPDEARRRAERAYQIAQEHHSVDVFANTTASHMRSFGQGDRLEEQDLKKLSRQPANPV